MEGAQDKVSRLRCIESNFYRFPVADLADEDYLRRLAEGRPQAIGKGIKISSQFTLVKGGFFADV
jgi:hypothetical protein